MARNITELIAARAFAGIGGGGITTSVLILVNGPVFLLNCDGIVLALSSCQTLHHCVKEEHGKVKKNTFRTTHVSHLTFPFLGVANMFFACGQAVGAPVGGLIADTIGWRWYVEQSLSPTSI